MRSTALAAIRNGEVDWWERPIPDLLPLVRADKALARRGHQHGGHDRLPAVQPPAIRRSTTWRSAARAVGDQPGRVRGGDRRLRSRAARRQGRHLPARRPDGERCRAGGDGRAPRLRRAEARVGALPGYKGERVVMLVGTDSPVNNAASEVLADLLRRWGSIWTTCRPTGAAWCSAGPASSRRTRAAGTCSRSARTATTSPTPRWRPPSAPMGGTPGSAGPPARGWRSLYRAWFTAPDQAARQAVARDVAGSDLAGRAIVIPLAQVFLPTVVRREVTGVLPGFPKFWNVRRA